MYDISYPQGSERARGQKGNAGAAGEQVGRVIIIRIYVVKEMLGKCRR